MPKTSCCCIPTPTSFCCNPILFKEFITLFGSSMAEHAEVSPDDWIALYVPRPKTASSTAKRFPDIPNYCKCCCDCPSTVQFDFVNTKSKLGFNNRVSFLNRVSSFFGAKSDASYITTPPNDPQPGDFENGGNEDCAESAPCGVNLIAYCTPGNPGYRNPDDPIHEICREGCCTGDIYESYIPQSDAIVFAYKYSGCKFIWWPREHTFGHNPYVSQCNGFVTRREIYGPNGESTNTFRETQNSCQPWSAQRPFAGGAFDTTPAECYANDLGNKLNQQNGRYPCACVPFPHIHGGVRDSIFNRVNVRLTPGQLGYVSYMSPFSPPMELSDVGCCWCACSGSAGSWDAFQEGRKNCFLQTYPFFDQQGKNVTQTNTCGVGINCFNYPSETISVGRNPNYRRSCFEWGLSPYLLKVAKESYKTGYEIWKHGRNADYRHDFGPTFVATKVTQNNLQKDFEIKFKKTVGRKTTLKEQYIGFVQLEHHFETYAYRSDAGSITIDMLPVQNNATLLITPFERPYSGKFTLTAENKINWTPWKYDSMMWQIRRGVPRRVMYQGSGVPIFHFDLVSMERISINKNITGADGYFNGARFLEHYYRYFYSILSYKDGSCEEVGDVPGPIEWNYNHLLDSYNYVTFWIEQMIVNGILRIKDHAIDISKDTNTIIATGQYVTDPDAPDYGDIRVPDSVAVITGGLSGYKDLINFFGVCAGNPSATTPKIIKEKLLNPDGLNQFYNSSRNLVGMNCFLPRKATLPLSETRYGLTAWGCTGNSPSVDIYDGLTCAQYTSDSINVPVGFFNVSDPNNTYSNLNPTAVYSGLGGTIVLDVSGKISIFGGKPEDGDGECNDLFTKQYPTSISCIPYYLSVLELYPSPTNTTLPSQIPDGKVIDVAFKGKNFATALVDFDNGGLGFLCTSPIDGNSENVADELPDQGPNCNGKNEIAFSFGSRCVANEPFYVIQEGGAVILGPRGASGEQRPSNAYRLKSWGSRAKIATFSLSEPDANIWNTKAFDPTINVSPDAGSSLRYPGTNTWFIWTKISSGMDHFCAIDDMGGLFITPLSDNRFNQSEKGKPLTYSESEAANYTGFGRYFNYYRHIPRPGYIKEDEWTQEFYNSITSPIATNTYRKYLCECLFSNPNCHPPSSPSGGNGLPCSQTEINILNSEGNCVIPETPIYDKTCGLMAKYIADPEYTSFFNSGYEPSYIDVAAGHYNTLLLTNENKLEIHGTYIRIDENGNPIGSGATAFIPEQLENLKGSWDVTYACTFVCDGVTHSPILEATYNPPLYNITQIDSSCDYSICSDNNGSLYVWGDASMVPDKYDPENYIPGQTAYNVLEFSYTQDTQYQRAEITKISAGVNAFYVTYKIIIPGLEDFAISKVYSYTRYGKTDFNLSAPDSIQNKTITDISAGYAFATAIYGEGIEAKTWDYDSFATDTKKYQYKNWNSLPAYFKRDAYFHAIPGGWDFSKWMYGANCCQKMSDPTHPSLDSDPCSILAYNIYDVKSDGTLAFNINHSYSGHPYYFWMRSDWRRLTAQGFGYVGSSDVGNEGVCDPDGSQLNDGAGNIISSDYGLCLASFASVWAEGRPASGKVVRQNKERIDPPCVRTGESNCYPDQEIYIRGVIPDVVTSIARSSDTPPIVSYRATKDLFLMMTTRYKPDSWGTDGDVPCTKHAQSPISYYKYCERHFYFGYDPQTEVWNIYQNPDYTHSIDSTREIYCDPIVEPLVGCCAGLTYIGAYPGSGFGGGGTGASGYYSLVDYPMTGPNYPRQDFVYVPSFLVTNYFILKNLQAALCRLFPESDEQECYTCGVNLGGTILDIIRYFTGYGAYVWKPTCRGTSIPDDLAPMWSPYYYNKAYISTLSSVQLLLGVLNTIDKNIPPNDDPNYINRPFIEVLKDVNYTEKTNPFYYENSTKWIPMFLESQNYFAQPICSIPQGYNPNEIAFAGREDAGSNYITYACTTTNVTFYSTPVICDLFVCCAPQT